MTKDFGIVTKNALDRTYFKPYELEFDFIEEHIKEYGNVPDKETFIERFPNFNIFDVTESDDYLVKSLNEEHIYTCVVPIIQQGADILKSNSIEAVNYIMNAIPKVNNKVGISTTDIIHNASERFEEYEKKLTGDDKEFYITTGFKEMDDVIHGFSRKEELVVLFARTNQGKSWILTKILTHSWQIGMNVGFISPEMSPTKIGYRFDTLFNHFDNKALNWGGECKEYDEYITGLSERKNSFCVSTPKDFGGQITVSKIKTFVKENNIQVLGIDGLSYILDERRNRMDNRQAELTHISEDLFALSQELNIPIITVVQANRDGVKVNGGNLELENIRDADGIAYNASKVISIRQKSEEEILELSIKKNRDGSVGSKFIYQWLPNEGRFTYIPSEEDGNGEENREAVITENAKKFERKGVQLF